VRVSWRLTPGDAGPLRLHWAESGGPPVTAAPSRRGFGSRVLEATIRDQLGGTVLLRWDREGLVCEMEIPRANLNRSTGAGPRRGPRAAAAVRESRLGRGGLRVLATEDEATGGPGPEEQ
jgi:hypothetical protein